MRFRCATRETPFRFESEASELQRARRRLKIKAKARITATRDCGVTRDCGDAPGIAFSRPDKLQYGTPRPACSPRWIRNSHLKPAAGRCALNSGRSLIEWRTGQIKLNKRTFGFRTPEQGVVNVTAVRRRID